MQEASDIYMSLHLPQKVDTKTLDDGGDYNRTQHNHHQDTSTFDIIHSCESSTYAKLHDEVMICGQINT